METKQNVKVEENQVSSQIELVNTPKPLVIPPKYQKKFVSTISNAKRKNIVGYLFLLPWIIGVVIFGLIPLLMTLVISFADVKWDEGPQLFFNISREGFSRNIFSNYINIFQKTSNLLLIGDFLKIELLYVPVIIVMAFILAYILVKSIRFKGIFRTIFFLPVIIMSGQLVTIILGLGEEIVTDVGMIEETGGSPLTQSFIFRIIASYSPQIANFIGGIFSNFIIILWLAGIPIILFINALNKINRDLYEAAKIDGANSWQMMWKITIPNCMFTAFVVSVFSIIQISVLPISPIYQEQIVSALRNIILPESQLGNLSALSIIYLILIISLIGIFALIFIPKQKKSKEILSYTQIEQLKDTRRRNAHLKKKKGEY